jgi:hypothetical protein
MKGKGPTPMWSWLRYRVPGVLMVLLALLSEPAGGVSRAQSVTQTPTVPRTSTPTTTPTATATPAPTTTTLPPATGTPSPSATPAANARPDGCERNERREDACPIALDAVNGPFTFLPAGDQDWYRVDLGAPNGLQPSITVRSSGTLDLLVSISGEDGRPLASFSSPAISTTLAADIGGPIIIRVENRSADDPTGSSYNVEVRKSLPPAPTPLAVGEDIPTLTPDVGENNWNVETAAPIAIGVIYDLNFTCPVPWGCGGGDHDYFAVPVKQGGKYLFATFDLGPGADTVLDLFWGSEDVALTSNDDYGTGMLSVIRWVAPSNGTAIVRVGPRNGGTQPIALDKESGFYRFAVALAGTDLEKQLVERINEQANIPTPTAPPTRAVPPTGGAAGGAPGPAPAPAPRPPATTANDAPKGEAVVSVESTVLREAPEREASVILTLPQESVVTLLGQASGAYVRVQPKGGVIPGWVRASDLQLLDRAAAISPPSATPTRAAAGTPGATSRPIAGPTTSASGLPAPLVSQLPTATPAAGATIAERVPLAVTVLLLQSSKSVISEKDPPSTLKVMAGVRIQLVNAFGDVLTEAVTPSSGQVSLTRDIEAGSGVYVRLPALGVQLALDPTKPTLTIKVPAGGG